MKSSFYLAYVFLMIYKSCFKINLFFGNHVSRFKIDLNTSVMVTYWRSIIEKCLIRRWIVLVKKYKIGKTYGIQQILRHNLNCCRMRNRKTHRWEGNFKLFSEMELNGVLTGGHGIRQISMLPLKTNWVWDKYEVVLFQLTI